jgi:rare lipoprotein A
LPAPPAAPQSIPDAVPRVEPRSRYGNPPYYDVFGKRYYVLSSGSGYVERGVASWYGPGFHKLRTSTGEPYDMYGMTAAHKTLPLPAYVRVTNLQNGRSVVVRVNDRGPFVGNRIIDLSYTAAAKLDMLRDGTAMVEVRELDPMAPAEDTSLMAAAAAAITGTTTAEAAPTANPAILARAAGTPMPVPATPVPVSAASSSASQAQAGMAPGSVPSIPAAAIPAAPAQTASPTSAASIPAADPAAPTVAAAPATSGWIPLPPDAAPGNAVSAGTGAAQTGAGAAQATVGTAALFIQAGAFAAPENAQRLAAKLRGKDLGKIFVRQDEIAGRRMYRVRIGPVPSVAEFDRIVAVLDAAGVHDAHLALN